LRNNISKELMLIIPKEQDDESYHEIGAELLGEGRRFV
jgi:hypothetical protein